MKTKDFFFDLPEDKVAQFPSDNRDESKLLCLNKDTGKIIHESFNNLPSLLPNGAIIVLNNSKVRKARLFAESETGGKVEFLMLKKTEETWTSISNKSKKQRIGKKYKFPGEVEGEIIDIKDNEKILKFSIDINDQYLDKYGHIPLPPYIKRDDQESDFERYQTVYAYEIGSIAAPTAGLHFSKKLIDEIKKRDIQIEYVTLHVGLGTFLPVKTDNIKDHKMHYEDYSIKIETANKINEGIKNKRPIIAVGTTSVRTLESSWNGEKIKSGNNSTNLFIYPGYRFNVVNHMITNFHTPGSSLLMLVSAFAGVNNIKTAYSEAIKNDYMFYSYGDSMYINDL